jgi:protein-S-isoprenylcysteine O-methyltransferase Ste14
LLIFKLVLGIIIQILACSSLLLVPAGTWHWWRAWLLIGVVLAASIATAISLFPAHQDLLEERLKPLFQVGQPLADKVVLVLFFAAFVGLMVLIPLDVFQLHLTDQPGPFVSVAGLLLFLLGWRIAYLSLRDNPFASPVVKHQGERQHTVVDTGVYGIVRHPMYAGAVLLIVGMPLWLQSYAAALLALVPIGLLVVRISVEEQFLLRELQCYRGNVERVRYRLIPWLW